MSFTVYKSSAGSGKTFTLVKEYLRIVLIDPYSFRNVLAITFTNKAANEMKERVIKYLKKLSAEQQDENSIAIKFLLPTLLDETKLSKEEIKANARKTLALILHNYSDFAISTIDSFIHKIVKTFAYDLRLPLNFEVELDAQKHLKQVIDVLINRVGKDEELTKILINFSKAKASDERDWRIEEDLLYFSNTLLREEGRKNINKIRSLSFDDYNEIASVTRKFTRNFKNDISAFASSAVQLIEGKNISLNAFSHGRSGIGNYFRKLSNKNNEDFLPNSYVLKTIDEDNWFSRKADDNEADSIEIIKHDLSQFYSQIKTKIETDYKRFKLHKLLYHQIYPIAVLNEIERIIDEKRQNDNIIHISEFNKRVAEVVLNEPIPFIYERLGERYKSFLIDEFQDTSVMQWNNLIPLVDNSLAEGHFNMIVGDGKQAIYRFRSGEVEQFAILPKIFKHEDLPLAKEREQNLSRNFTEKFLCENYRSKKEIVEFNNQLFRSLAGLIEENYQKIYNGLEQQFDESNSGGLVRIDLIEKKSSDEWQDQNLKRIKAIILELKEDLFNFGDVAILCRTNKTASLIANYLLAEKIPIVSSESLLLSSSPELNFIMTIFTYLMNPNDKISKTAILQYLISSEKINENLNAALREIELESTREGEVMDKFVSYLETYEFNLNRALLINLPVYDLCEEVIRIFKLNEVVNPFLQFFLDAALKSTIQGKTNVSDFIQWWNENKNKESVILPESQNAIQILTIHKSKGLEFPVVIYPFADDDIKTTLKNVWIDINDEALPKLKTAYLPLTKTAVEHTDYEIHLKKEQSKSFLDAINLLYVTCTRPSVRLYMITEKISRKKSEKASIPKLIDFYLNQLTDRNEIAEFYQIGVRKKKIELVKEEDKITIQMDYFVSENWRKKLLISTAAPEVWDMDNPERNKDWGNLIHLILSKIIDESNVNSVIDNFLETGIIADEEKDEIIKTLSNLLSHPEVKRFFIKGLKIKNEAEILLPDGHLLRPDRLVFEEDKLIIIDYKTGKPESRHRLQLNKYAREISKLGYTKIEKYLIYIDSNIQVLKVA